MWLDSSCQWKLKGHAWPDRDFILVNPCFVQFSIIFYPSPLAYALLLCRYLQAEIIKTTKYMTTVNKKFKQRSPVKEDARCKIITWVSKHAFRSKLISWDFYHCLHNNIILDCGKDARENAEWYLEVWHDVLAGWQLRGMS